MVCLYACIWYSFYALKGWCLMFHVWTIMYVSMCRPFRCHLSVFWALSRPTLGLFWVPSTLWDSPCIAVVWSLRLALGLGLGCMLCLSYLIGLAPFLTWFQSLLCLSLVHDHLLLSVLKSPLFVLKCWTMFACMFVCKFAFISIAFWLLI